MGPPRIVEVREEETEEVPDIENPPRKVARDRRLRPMVNGRARPDNRRAAVRVERALRIPSGLADARQLYALYIQRPSRPRDRRSLVRRPPSVGQVMREVTLILTPRCQEFDLTP